MALAVLIVIDTCSALTKIRSEVTAMRILFSALALPLLLFSLTATKEVPDADRENLHGPVRSVSTQMAQYFDAEADGAGRIRQLDIITYDSKGNEVERTIYDDYGFVVGKQVVTRDADGSLVGRVLSDPKGKVLERQAYVYTGGRLAEIVERDGKGNVALRQVSTYGADGLVQEVTYYAATKAVGKTVYKHDAHGRGSEVAYYRADGSRAIAPIGPCLGAHRMTYAYDEKGRSAKVVAYEPDGSLNKSWQYSYNSAGDVAEERREDRWSHEISTISYEYDSRGNWIKRIAVVQGQPKPGRGEMKPSERRLIHSRKITYY
ncbi:MAG TPA: hypothetical protein VFZ91_06125 [Allosphingosinicella sp.]